MKTEPNDPIVHTVYRQTGKDSYRPATQKEITEGIYLVHKEGLTKREYFSAMAMMGMLANSSNCNTQWDYETIGKHCALAADALIKALNGTQP